LAGLLASGAVAIVFCMRASPFLTADEPPIATAQNPAVLWRKNVAKPIVRPSMLRATEAKMRPDELVIGIEVGGRARAYCLRSLDHPMGHLINDMVGETAVSIAYCNLSRCVQVYSDPNARAPLDAEIAGVLNREMIIKLRGVPYYHRTGEPVEPAESPAAIPYNLLTPTLAKWDQWSRQHPETEVYVGNLGVVRRENMLRAMP
jgi:hypothetical protein